MGHLIYMYIYIFRMPASCVIEFNIPTLSDCLVLMISKTGVEPELVSVHISHN